jgi:hypothetical protein
MLPHLGGAGPLAHRYLTALFRERAAQTMLALAVVAPLGTASYFRFRGDAEDLDDIRWIMVGMPIYLTFIFVSIVRFDFRADFTVLDFLKTLPLRPFPCAVGGVIAPTVFATAIQTLPTLVFAVASGAAPVPPRFLFLLLPANFLWFAIDNAFYLRAPSPMRKGMNSDPNEVARQFVSVMVRGMILAMVAAVISGSYFAMWSISGSVAAATATAWVVIIPVAAWSAYLAGVALRDLDLSRDVL